MYYIAASIVNTMYYIAASIINSDCDRQHVYVAINKQQVVVNEEAKRYVLIVNEIEQCTTRYVSVIIYRTVSVLNSASTTKHIRNDPVCTGR